MLDDAWGCLKSLGVVLILLAILPLLLAGEAVGWILPILGISIAITIPLWWILKPFKQPSNTKERDKNVLLFWMLMGIGIVLLSVIRILGLDKTEDIFIYTHWAIVGIVVLFVICTIVVYFNKES